MNMQSHLYEVFEISIFDINSDKILGIAFFRHFFQFAKFQVLTIRHVLILNNFCLYTFPLVRPAQAIIQNLTAICFIEKLIL